MQRGRDKAGSRTWTKPQLPGPAPELPPPPWALSAGITPAAEATAVLTVRLWLLGVAHSQGPGFGLFFVPPNGGVELLVINWTKETRGHVRKNAGTQEPQTRGAGVRGAASPEAYIGCAARNSPPCWWAQRMSRCLSSCSAALPADGPWHPPWK